jgi:hypothetical protein
MRSLLAPATWKISRRNSTINLMRPWMMGMTTATTIEARRGRVFAVVVYSDPGCRAFPLDGVGSGAEATIKFR